MFGADGQGNARLLARSVIASRPGEFEVRDTYHEPGASYPRHAHEDASVFVVLSGRVDDRSGSLGAECTPGFAGFLPRFGEHRSDFGTVPVRCLDFVISAEWLEKSFGATRVGCAPKYGVDARLSVWALGLLSECRLQRIDQQQLAIDELVLELVSVAINCGESASAPELRRPDWLRDVVEVLTLRNAPELGLSYVADAVGRHPAHVCRAFRARFGCSLHEYVRRRRVEEAVTMLRTTRHSLSQIALETGFSDQAHLTRTFRAFVGTTPGAYRASVR